MFPAVLGGKFWADELGNMADGCWVKIRGLGWLILNGNRGHGWRNFRVEIGDGDVNWLSLN